MTIFALHALAMQVRTKRGDRPLREVAREIEGVSLSTLSRIENGKEPDIDTFLALCDWLGLSPCTFFQDAPVQMGEVEIVEQIELALRSAPFLTPEFVSALICLIRLFQRKESTHHG